MTEALAEPGSYASGEQCCYAVGTAGCSYGSVSYLKECITLYMMILCAGPLNVIVGIVLTFRWVRAYYDYWESSYEVMGIVY